MNQRDKNNLDFIMNLQESEVTVWWNSISDDDKQYALELLDNYRKSLRAKSINYAIDREIDNFDDARALLSKWCKITH